MKTRLDSTHKREKKNVNNERTDAVRHVGVLKKTMHELQDRSKAGAERAKNLAALHGKEAELQALHQEKEQVRTQRVAPKHV